MIRINENYNELQKTYFFSEIYKRVEDFQNTNPDKEIIKMGVGDVTKPLPSVCVAAMHHAADEMSSEETFKGYGPYEGFLFLREKIIEYDFKTKGIDLSVDVYGGVSASSVSMRPWRSSGFSMKARIPFSMALSAFTCSL